MIITSVFSTRFLVVEGSIYHVLECSNENEQKKLLCPGDIFDKFDELPKKKAGRQKTKKKRRKRPLQAASIAEYTENYNY